METPRNELDIARFFRVSKRLQRIGIFQRICSLKGEGSCPLAPLGRGLGRGVQIYNNLDFRSFFLCDLTPANGIIGILAKRVIVLHNDLNSAITGRLDHLPQTLAYKFLIHDRHG